MRLPSLTEKDRADLQWGVEHDVDFVAASFIRKASDVQEVRAWLKECQPAIDAEQGLPLPRIISKIETGEALLNFDEILKVTEEPF